MVSAPTVLPCRFFAGIGYPHVHHNPTETMATLHTSTGGYVLGHSDFELKRLSRQAEMIGPMTRRYFLEAGIRPGMRVLDVGSGAGDVALLLAELVGPSGEVVGFDRVPAALETAQSRVADKGIAKVSFVEWDPLGPTLQAADASSEQGLTSLSVPLPLQSPFDAIAGRYILMFQADPAALLRAILPLAKPGAPVVFHEVDWRGCRSTPKVDSFDECCRWLIATLIATGTDYEMGLKMHETFVAAGLPAPTMGIDAQVGGGPRAAELVELVTDLAISVAPTIQSCGAATAAEMDVRTLQSRILEEIVAKNAVAMGRFETGAWTRTPG